jgi:hypothetical protein
MSFDESQLRKAGFVQRADGSWHKPDPRTSAGVAAVPDTGEKPPRRGAASGADAGKKRGKGSVYRGDSRAGRDPTKIPQVYITSFRMRLLDGDNMVGGSKYLQDAIASHLGVDDSELDVRWHYAQAEVRTRDEEGTLVRVVVPDGDVGDQQQ